MGESDKSGFHIIFGAWLMVRMTLFTILLFCFNQVQASVWEVQNQWNDDWEQKFSAWMNTNWDASFFQRPETPYYRLKVDCADSVYTARAVFSFENNLPFVIVDNTGGKQPISQKMGRWDHLPKNERIRAFLTYLYQMVSTESLPKDTFLVQISRDYIRGGTVVLTDPMYGHSWIVKRVSEYGIPNLIYGTVPAKSLLFEWMGFPNVTTLFPWENKQGAKSGFRNFRWPEYIGIPEWKIPGFGDEQYKIETTNWTRTVQKKLAIKEESDELMLNRLMDECCFLAQERVKFVDEAIERQRQNGYQCFSLTEYDDLSTPSRDLRLEYSLKTLASTVQEILNNPQTRKNISSNTITKINNIMVPTGYNPDEKEIRNSYCPFFISSTRQISLGIVYDRFVRRQYSSNPHNSIEARWGLTSEKSELAKKCFSYDPQ